ncbi:MAG: hypothetical protein WCJ30_16065, partial [Deltaproteobacteria bacterium]
ATRPAVSLPVAAPTPEPEASFANSPFAGLEDQIRALMTAVPPEALAAMQQAMASGDPAQISAMENQLQSMVGQGQLAALQESLISAFGGVDPEDAESPGEDPMEALLAHAQAQMEEIEKTDPAAFEQLQKQLGAMGVGALTDKKK